MNEVTEKLTNTTYKTLKILYDFQVTLPDGTTYVPVSQAEVSRILIVSTITMNGIFKELKQSELVYPYTNRRGTYILTEKAIHIVNVISELDEKGCEE